MNHKILISIICIVTLIVTMSNAQNIIFVDKDSPAPTPDGQSWGTAFVLLQDALELVDQAAPNTYEIWVAEGTYKPTKAQPFVTVDSRILTFYFTKDVKLFGGFNGTESNRDDRDYFMNETILSGDLGIPNDSTDNAYHVVVIRPVGGHITNDFMIDGFIIEKGYANRTDFPNQVGGGILHRASAFNTNLSSPMILNCIIRDNFGSAAGGGMYNTFHNNPTIVNCAFYGNYTDGQGAAISNVGVDANTFSSFNITNCTFYNNQGSSTINNLLTDTGLIANSVFWGNMVFDAIVGDLMVSIENSLLSTTFCPVANCTNTLFDIDPLFVDPANGNFQLQSNSPAIDQGNSGTPGLTGLLKDLQNSDRLSSPCNNLMVDMGAYERQFVSPNAGYTMANALGGIQSLSQDFITDHSIESDQVIDPNLGAAINVTYQAGLSNPNNSIDLFPNFEVVADQMFQAFFSNGCP